MFGAVTLSVDVCRAVTLCLCLPEKEVNELMEELFETVNTPSPNCPLATSHGHCLQSSKNPQAEDRNVVFQLKEDLAAQEVDDEDHEEEEETHTAQPHTPEDQHDTYVTAQVISKCYNHAPADLSVYLPEWHAATTNRMDQSQSCVR